MYEDKHSAFLEAIIELRTEKTIADKLGTTTISKPIKNSMGKMVTHLMEHIITHKEKNVKITNGGAFFYPIKEANHGNHVQINGKKFLNSRFTLFNDSLRICTILEKGSGVDFEGKTKVKNHLGDDVNPLSSLIFCKDIQPLVREFYGDIFDEVKERKVALLEVRDEMAKEYQVISARDVLLGKLLKELDRVSGVLELEKEVAEIEKEGVLHLNYNMLDDAKNIVSEVKPYYELLTLVIQYSSKAPSTFVNRHLGKDITEEVLVNEIASDEDFIEHFSTTGETEAEDIKHEYAFETHINLASLAETVDFIKSRISELEQKEYVRGEDHSDEILENKNKLTIIDKIVGGEHRGCIYHDGCIVTKNTYVSKEGGCGRLTDGNSLQSAPKQVRYGAIPSGHIYDIGTSVFSILRYLAITVDPSIASRISHVSEYIDNKDAIRNELAQRVFTGSRIPEDMWVKIIKGAFTGIGFGGDLTCTSSMKNGKVVAHQTLAKSFMIDQYAGNKDFCIRFTLDEFVVNFYKEFQEIRDVVCKYFADKEIIPGRKFTGDKDTELLAYIYQGFESMILRGVLDTLLVNDGVNGQPFNTEKSILPLHDGLYVSWGLDDFMLKQSIVTVLGSKYPEYLPKFEHTIKYNKALVKKAECAKSVEEVEHRRMIAEQERLASEYVPVNILPPDLNHVVDTYAKDKIVEIENARKHRALLASMLRGEIEYEDAGIDEDMLRW